MLVRLRKLYWHEKHRKSVFFGANLHPSFLPPSLPFFLSHQGLLKKPGQKSLVQDVSACCDDVESSFISLSLRFLVNENLDPKASLDLSSLFLAGTLCRCVA